MNEKDTTRISKFLSLGLRHEPGKIGITLDGEGSNEGTREIAGMA